MIIDISLIVAKKYGIIFDKREGRIMPYNTNIINSIINEARKNMVELPWIEFKENYTQRKARQLARLSRRSDRDKPCGGA